MPPELITRFFDYGGIACVLAWFLLKAEPRLRSMEDAIDMLSESIQLLLISLDYLPPRVQERASRLNAELTEKRLRENKR